MTVVLLPRLDALEVDKLIAGYLTKAPKNLTLTSSSGLPGTITFASSGGQPATILELHALQKSVVELAIKWGFPQKRTKEGQARFDEDAAILLSALPMFDSGEAFRDDVWAFIAAKLLPEVTFWRLGASAERFSGGIRNAFQSLWIRGKLFDRGKQSENRWELLRNLTEDAFVAITERTAISSDPVLALAAAEAWNRAAHRFGKPRMQEIMRKAAIGIRLRNLIVMLNCLDQASLASTLDGEFDRAERAVRMLEKNEA